jgi:hypothetical protein
MCTRPFGEQHQKVKIMPVRSLYKLVLGHVFFQCLNIEVRMVSRRMIEIANM